MAFIYQEGMLEPLNVEESVIKCAKCITESDNNLFYVFTDFAGEPVIVNLAKITKITETE